jgi:hypothetical protein
MEKPKIIELVAKKFSEFCSRIGGEFKRQDLDTKVILTCVLPVEKKFEVRYLQQFGEVLVKDLVTEDMVFIPTRAGVTLEIRKPESEMLTGDRTVPVTASTKALSSQIEVVFDLETNRVTIKV